MTPAETLLRRTADIIAAPGTWTKKAYARTADGAVCAPSSRFACQWCADGAMWKAQWDLGISTPSYDRARGALLAVLQKRHGTLSIVNFNDAAQDVALVVAVFREAAEDLARG